MFGNAGNFKEPEQASLESVATRRRNYRVMVNLARQSIFSAFDWIKMGNCRQAFQIDVIMRLMSAKRWNHNGAANTFAQDKGFGYDAIESTTINHGSLAFEGAGVCGPEQIDGPRQG